ncbi:DNA-directed RNA polymerase I subunit RPA2 [Corythoichthys intestinalis]|uniref:DNA-directed RNA polymerase I subunit RPA2 n=1 Tax=Corythoichthys intestinalis TaxID=161448 RepID=UPI0025A517C0|nr:DNA-directed RNA polymerase I subunit RPA2 [Corythoichthys intestinalis]XP_057697377.1 DNA-directed RNA polymerase I subunit RPA2 [Corythoichthys intestinalis]XP_061790487.1 DNA-directed RNA polymerase I subunit RPA2-like [Nerophis lumbriciformis]
MDDSEEWNDVAKSPSLKNLTDGGFGVLKDKQCKAVQDLVRAHIESFDQALGEGLNRVVQSIPPLEFMSKEVRIGLTFVDACVFPPAVSKGSVCRETRVFPAECRGRRCSYRGRIVADVSWSVNGVPKGIIKQSLGQIPIMVKSKLCNLDGMTPRELVSHHEEAEEMGGYFIVNGMEKVIRMLVMPRRNYPVAMSRPKWKSRGPGYTQYGISMRCVKEEHTAVNMNLHYLENGTVMLNFIYLKELFFLPLGFALKALVDLSDFEIFSELVKGVEDNSFYRSCACEMLRLVSEEGCTSQSAVLQYLGQRFRVKLYLPEWYTDQQCGSFLLDECICIHLRTGPDKFRLLCLMTRKLFALAKQECLEENPDGISCQEILTPGQLFLMFLKERMSAWLTSVKLAFEKRGSRLKGSWTVENVIKMFNLGTDLTKPFEYLLATGNLSSKSGLGLLQNTGLCVVADKLNFIRYVSHFRCVHRGAAFAKMRTTSVRKLLPESWGFLCPVHTPDGEPCGLMNHMTASCRVVTESAPTAGLLALVCALGATPADAVPARPFSECYPVLIDGALVGWAEAELAPGVVDALRRFKVLREKKVAPWTEIVLVPKTGKASLYPGLFLFTTPCRMMRPVRNLELGKRELIGTFEQLYVEVAVTESEVRAGVTGHQELFPHSMLSVVANFIPYSDHNQSPRNMYQCQMGKQTMGFPLHAFLERSDNKLYRLQTPQSPLVRPSMYDRYQLDNYPSGTNAVVAVISYTGYDMEDAMIVNKSSWERGFADGCIYKTEMVDLADKARGQEGVVFGAKPGDPKVNGRLDADGLPPVGATLSYGDPYYSYVNLNTGQAFVTLYKSNEACVVDNIKICGNDAGTGSFKRVCITVRVARKPTIGDKFASRHGQKGILSRLWPAEDMPFGESGVSPDILFNPHGFPSRMTIGMLIESMAGKSAALHGLSHDATPFAFSEENSALDYFGQALRAGGYNYYGTERLYSGTSGLELEADIFVGVVYYQRLRHMVSDKFQVRTTGARDKVTNQPVGGRNVQGGIRFGEMERDALLAHGSSFLLHDRLFNCSDRSVARVCVDCGSLLSPLLERPPPAWSSARHRRTVCALCGKSDSVDTLTVPYVFRYFVAELAAMNIKVKLDVK